MWFQDAEYHFNGMVSREFRRASPQFYHLTTWSRHSFNQKPPLTPNISHIACPSPTASCWTLLSRGTGTCFRLSLKKRTLSLGTGTHPNHGVSSLVWKAALLMGVLQTQLRHCWSSFFRRTFVTPELSLHLCWAGCLDTSSQWGWSELQSKDSALEAAEQSCMSSSSPRNTLHHPITYRAHKHDPFEGGHSTAGPAGFQSHPKAKGKSLVQLQEAKI